MINIMFSCFIPCGTIHLLCIFVVASMVLISIIISCCQNRKVRYNFAFLLLRRASKTNLITENKHEPSIKHWTFSYKGICIVWCGFVRL